MMKINVVEIGPRDGFQSVDAMTNMMIPTEKKLEIIEAILASGVRHLQCTSFVSPKIIPQMQDASAIASYLTRKYPELDIFALVPNFNGAKAAVESGLKKISAVISLSESHNMNNTRRTRKQSLDEVRKIRETYPNLLLTVDVATSFGCPFEGRFQTSVLVDFIGILHEMGNTSFNICDTIGIAYPMQVREVFTALFAAFPEDNFSVHIHDTRNMGVLNSYEAVRCGVNTVQTTLGGLGGCPFAPGASGNTSTEDFIYLLHLEGYETGIDFHSLLEAAKMQMRNVPGNYSGHHIHIQTEQTAF